MRRKKDDGDAFLGIVRLLADGSSQPILIANERVEIEYVNAAWEEQFGYSLAEVRGENPRLLQSGKTHRDVYDRMWRALHAEKMFQTDEVVDRKKDGTHFNLLTTIFPLRHKNCLLYVQILDERTERARVEAEEVRQQFARAGTPQNFF